MERLEIRRIETLLRQRDIYVMRYVVKDKQTGNFLSSSGAWTKYLGQAQQFPNSLSVGLHLEGARDRALAEQVEVIRIGVN